MSETQQARFTPLDFDDAAPHCEPVRVNGKVLYWLHEASEGDAAKFTSARAKTARMVNGKVVGVEGGGEIPSLLVSLCLYRADSNGEMPRLKDGSPDVSRRIPQSVILSWKPRMVQRLFERAKTISELGEQETEESLLKQVEEINERLKELRAEKEEGEPAKNGLDSSTAN